MTLEQLQATVMSLKQAKGEAFNAALAEPAFDKRQQLLTLAESYAFAEAYCLKAFIEKSHVA